MSEPGAPEVIASRLRDITVLAQSHAASKSGAVSRQSSADAGLGATSYRVNDAGDSPAPAKRPQRLELNLAANAATAKERRIVELPTGIRFRGQRPKPGSALRAGVGLGRHEACRLRG